MYSPRNPQVDKAVTATADCSSSVNSYPDVPAFCTANVITNASSFNVNVSASFSTAPCATSSSLVTVVTKTAICSVSVPPCDSLHFDFIYVQGLRWEEEMAQGVCVQVCLTDDVMTLHVSIEVVLTTIFRFSRDWQVRAHTHTHTHTYNSQIDSDVRPSPASTSSPSLSASLAKITPENAPEAPSPPSL